MSADKKDLPAILGGTPAVSADQSAVDKWPLLDSSDEEAVLEIIRDGDISTHPVIRELEMDYCEYFNMPYSLSHCNGTAALLAAFFAVGLKPGDEVLVPSATFWASVLPMTWLGAVPVFCESEKERMGLDPEDLRKKITDRTRAIVVVHLWGLPSKMTEILEIASENDLRIIEDASHAQGASWRGRACGTLGDVSVFSLQGSKLAPAGEGGILMCREYEYWERAVCLGDITRIIELETPQQRFAATSFGIKTRIAPMSAAVARVQLRKLAAANRKRNENIEYLSNKMEPLGISTFLPPAHIKRVYFEFLVKASEEKTGLPLELLTKSLQAEGCLTGPPRYPLLHKQPFFTEGAVNDVLRLVETVPEYRPDDLPQTIEAGKDMLKLPSFPDVERKVLDQYAAAFAKVIGSSEKIKQEYG